MVESYMSYEIRVVSYESLEKNTIIKSLLILGVHLITILM